MLRRFAFAALLFSSPSAQAQSKAPVTPADYGKWESPAATALSPNGLWLAYGVNRVNENNELRLRDLRRDTTFVIPLATSIAFTPDSRWIGYLITVSPAVRERLERDKKPVRTALGFRDLSTGKTDSVADVQAFR